MTVHPQKDSRASDLETIAVKTGQLLVPILRVRFTITRKKNSQNLIPESMILS